MVVAQILQEFMPEVFNIEFKANMEEQEDVGVPTLEANAHDIEYEGELKESTLEVNMHHFYHGDPDEIHKFALQGAVACESGKDDSSSKEDNGLQLILFTKGVAT
jgi:hypothetical protein